jgi:hypothetical protein
VAEPPTITGFQFREETVASGFELADRFGEPVWVPAEWPVGLNPPQLLFMSLPPGGSHDDAHHFRSHYQLRSITDGQLLVVSGHRRRPGNLEHALLPLEGERFETWTRPVGQKPHIVIRAPLWDVHVWGSVTFDTTRSVARGLVQVADR